MYRDIDPTVVIKKGKNNRKVEINLNEIYDNFDMDNERWLKDFSDIPDIDKLINLPLESYKWVLLDGHYTWTEPTKIGRKSLIILKRFWIMIKGYIVRAKEFNNMIKQLKDVNFMGRWIPECMVQTSLFNKEYFCSSAFEFLKGLLWWC